MKQLKFVLNKFKFYQKLTSCGFRTILTYVDKDLFFKDQSEGLISYPVFIKPIKGSASIGVNFLYSREEVEFFLKDIIIF
jgi:carbamoyl-phosphate synthase large subunit